MFLKLCRDIMMRETDSISDPYCHNRSSESCWSFNFLYLHHFFSELSQCYFARNQGLLLSHAQNEF